MTIVELRGRGGQLLDRVRCADGPIRIGRAFTNDVVLDDSYASPCHLILTRIEDGWRFEDQDSLNGVRHGGRRSAEGVIASGDELRIGHTVLRVFDADHPVEPATPLGGAEARLAAMGRTPIWALLLIGLLAASFVDQLWETVDDFEPMSTLSPLSLEVLFYVIMAAFWALIGRVLRHRAYFLAHLAVWLGFTLVELVFEFVVRALAYNLGSSQFEAVGTSLMSTVLFAGTVWCSMALATPLTGRKRALSAAGVAVAVAGLLWSAEFEFDHEFTGQPGYYARVEGPNLLWVNPVPEATLPDQVAVLADRADALREEEAAEAEAEPDEAVEAD